MSIQLELPVSGYTDSLNKMKSLTTLEICAGAGGQALGYERAEFDHAGLVEIDKRACETLRLNRPDWNVLMRDLNTFDGSGFKGVDLVTGGLPCPPFSVAGKSSRGRFGGVLGESVDKGLGFDLLTGKMEMAQR